MARVTTLKADAKPSLPRGRFPTIILAQSFYQTCSTKPAVIFQQSPVVVFQTVRLLACADAVPFCLTLLATGRGRQHQGRHARCVPTVSAGVKLCIRRLTLGVPPEPKKIEELPAAQQGTLKARTPSSARSMARWPEVMPPPPSAVVAAARLLWRPTVSG